MNEFDAEIKKIIEKHGEKLLDPFYPVYPMPGMWHFAFGSIFALIVFAGTFVVVLSFFDVHLLYQMGIGMLFSVILTISMILCTRGHQFPAKIILIYAIVSTVTIPIFFFIESNNYIYKIIVLSIGITAIYLLTSRTTRMLLVIMTVRNQKIRDMKKNGTYKQNLAEARLRLNRR